MRLINRLLAALLSIALIVGGVLVLIEILADRIVARPALIHWHGAYDWAARTRWDQNSVRVTCIVIAVVGLILLLVELRRGKPARLPTVSDITDAAYTRRAVAATVRSAVDGVDGITHTAVTVKRRKIKVAATTAGRQRYTAQSLQEPVTDAARQRLDTLELSPAPALSVRIETRSR